MVIYSWITHQKWWFSIVMLVYRRVSVFSILIFEIDSWTTSNQEPAIQVVSSALGRCPKFPAERRWSSWCIKHTTETYLYNSVYIFYYSILNYIIIYYIILYYIILYYILNYIILYYSILYSIIVYYIILYIILYHI